MIVIAIDTVIYLIAAALGVALLARGVRGAWAWIAVGAINFAILSAIEWSLGGPGSLLRFAVLGVPFVQVAKQCGTGFFLAMGLYRSRREAGAASGAVRSDPAVRPVA